MRLSVFCYIASVCRRSAGNDNLKSWHQCRLPRVLSHQVRLCLFELPFHAPHPLLPQDCCQKFHQGRLALSAGDPETLLRARYSAWVKGAVPYLRKSCHPDNPCLQGSDPAPDAGVSRHCSFEEDVAVTLACLRFEKLEVLKVYPDDEIEGRMVVEYAVSFKRVIGSDGKKLKPPVRDTIQEKAVVVKDEDKGWLLLETAPLRS